MGLSLEDIARRIKKEPAELRDWENGNASPTYVQLEKLAYSVYKRPVAVFFFPDVPKEENPKTEFRTLPDTIIDTLTPGLIRLYRKSKIFQYNLHELFDGEKPIESNLLDNISLTAGSNIPQIAKQIREILQISLDIQYSWVSTEDAFKAWRNVLEENGIFIFKDAFKDDKYSGLCIYDELYPIIFVNNSMPHSRQIFTLFHELGHLLFHSGGIDFFDYKLTESLPAKFSKIEQVCNQFANEVLVPSEIFVNISEDINASIIENLANKFSVSREVILRNFLKRKMIDNASYQSWVLKWNQEAEKKPRKSGGNYHYTQKAYLGDKYIQLAYRKYYQNKIDIVKLSAFLNIKPKNISNIVWKTKNF